MSRRKKEEDSLHPAIKQNRELRKERTCLKCELAFQSKSPGNRICGKCKRLMIDTDLPMIYRSQLKEETDE
jgi:hypothetical protein